MNYVSKFFPALLTLMTMAASALAQGTASPDASITPKAVAPTMPGPTPLPCRILSPKPALPKAPSRISMRSLIRTLSKRLSCSACQVLSARSTCEMPVYAVVSDGPSLDTLGELISLWEG